MSQVRTSVGPWKHLTLVFVKDARARQEKHCKVFAGMEIKTFQVGFVPISRAFHAH